MLKKLNEELKQFLEEITVDDFKKELIKAFENLGVEIIKPKGYSGYVLCHIKPNFDCKPLEDYIEYCCMTWYDKYFAIKIFDGNPWKLPDVIQCYAETSVSWFDDNDYEYEEDFSSDGVTFTEGMSFEDLAKGILEKIQDMVAEPKEYIFEPDWEERILNAEEDRREAAILSRYDL